VSCPQYGGVLTLHKGPAANMILHKQSVGAPMSTVESVKVDISVVLGTARLPMQQLLRMGRGAVIELDSNQNDEVWVLANNKPIARAEIVIQGDKVAVSITDTLKSTS
jgi:flagellar motor switch protein FliN/FliY